MTAVQLLEGGAFPTVREVALDEPGELRVAAGVGVATRPVVALVGDAEQPLVASDTVTTLGASMTLGRWMRVGVSAPWHAWASPGGVAFGRSDVALFVGVPVGHEVAIHAEQSLGGAGAGRWLGAPSSAFAVVGAGAVGAFRFAGDAGVRLQQRVELPGSTWGPRAELGGGVRRQVSQVGAAALELGAEGRLSAPLGGPLTVAALPAEVDLTAALVGERVRAQLTGGAGVTNGLGSPGLRVGTQVDWRVGRPRDRDRDRVWDVVDGCDRAPEDRDRFEDRDGCPDDDDDGDGIVDAVDVCRRVPESFNGWRDTDGCPDERAWVAVRLEGAETLSVRLGDDVFQLTARAPTRWTVDPGRWPVSGAVTEDSVVVPEGPSELTLHALPPAPAAPEVPSPRTDADPVPFALDDDHVPPSAGPALDELAAWLLDRPEVLVLRVEGHADEAGTSAYNLSLSRRRAAAVVAALAARGVAPERLEAVGSGEVLAEDRSVTFRVLAWDERGRGRVDLGLVDRFGG